MDRLNDILTQSSHRMLLLLSGRRSENVDEDEDVVVNASFEDMGVAIQSLLKAREVEDDDENVGRKIGDLG